MTNTQQEYLKSLLAPLGFADKLKNFCGLPMPAKAKTSFVIF